MKAPGLIVGSNLQFQCPCCRKINYLSLLTKWDGGELDGGYCSCDWLYSVCKNETGIWVYDMQEWDEIHKNGRQAINLIHSKEAED